MKIGITEKAKTLISKMQFNIKKHSPEILISLGVGGVIVSAITACISTTKVKRIMNESKEKIKEIHKRAAADSEFSEQNKKKALTAVYLRTGVKLIKLYAPSVVLGTFSLTSIVTSNRILRKRSAAIAAAYTAIDQGFKNYRANVVERFGEEVDKELKYGIKTEKVTVKTTDPETGKETKVKKEIKVANLGPDGYSEYARLFDSTCKGWTKESEYNHMFLNMEQSYANDLLVVNGYLFLNDVYDRLGIPRSQAGQVVGWIYDKDNPVGDNYVSFGITDSCIKNGDEYEDAIILDFNVDGVIMDRALLTK